MSEASVVDQRGVWFGVELCVDRLVQESDNSVDVFSQGAIAVHTFGR